MANVEWRRATASDAALLADLAGRTSDTNIGPDQALAFLRSWHVEIADLGRAAIAVLPPASGHSRGYGAWWSRHGSAFDRFSEIGGRLVQLAASTPGLSILQISLPEDRDVDVEQLRALRFDRAYPLWTMVHDDNSWPDRQPELPVPLRFGRWSDVGSDEFQSAYEQAYRDQRPVEPHTAEAWERLTSGNSFATDLAALAVAPDGQVAGFVLSFHQNHGGIELGRAWLVAWVGIERRALASVVDPLPSRRGEQVSLADRR